MQACEHIYMPSNGLSYLLTLLPVTFRCQFADFLTYESRPAYGYVLC
jgi:hypothetical protein